MKNKLIVSFFVLISSVLFAQTKVSGIVVDNTNQPVPYANVVFKGSNELEKIAVFQLNRDL